MTENTLNYRDAFKLEGKVALVSARRRFRRRNMSWSRSGWGIAAGVIYLASNASKYVIGSELVIDGDFNAS